MSECAVLLSLKSSDFTFTQSIIHQYIQRDITMYMCPRVPVLKFNLRGISFLNHRGLVI